MAFNASKTVMALEYDFRPFLEVRGVTPEPSSDEVRHFLWETQRIMRSIVSGEGDNVEISDLTEDEYAQFSEAVLDTVADITKGEPSREEIAALPHRIQKAYIAWLRKELTDPEAPSDASKGSRVRKLSVAPSTSPGVS